jgi:hypothetical protein
MDVPRAAAYTCATLRDRHPDADGLHLAFRILAPITESNFDSSRLLPLRQKECIELTIGNLELAYRV